jgi:hypothetical protein
MGLDQYIKEGHVLKRNTVTLTTSAEGTGSVELGSTYALLSIATDAVCRVRLYDNEVSTQFVGEISRSFEDTYVASEVALIGDFNMSSPGSYTIDPVVYGVVDDAASKLTYYLVDGGPATLTFNVYSMEDSEKSTTNRTTLPNITASLSAGQYSTGTIVSEDIPRTYLLVKALTPTTTTITRLRLYSTPASLTNPTEVSRSFSVEPASTANLLVDMIIQPDETIRFMPKIVGANLKTMGTDLNAIQLNLTAVRGVNELYYIVENVEPSGGPSNITVQVHVFSLET